MENIQDHNWVIPQPERELITHCGKNRALTLPDDWFSSCLNKGRPGLTSSPPFYFFISMHLKVSSVHF